MREQLLTLARQIARAIRAALDSKGTVADDTAQGLREALPPQRLWGLAVVLASWELSKPERNRAELAGLVTGGSGVTAFWPQLDLFAPQLDPFIQACRDAQQPVEIAEAALRFFDAVHQIGPSIVRNVLKSRDFRRAAEVIARILPEGDSPPKPSQKPTPATKVVDAAEGWKPGGRLAEREDIATGYLSFIGWPRADVERFLSGKR